ncbi:MAG TPA: hydantoinase/oxoprolinase family protein [Beijerinckiaceae bacterium]|jgi:N-methylhydantoinase A
MSAGTIVGVDVGGTFTDLFFLDAGAGRYATAKVATTLDNQADGIVQGVASQGDVIGEIATLVHGTTTATNALLERKGAVIGLIATRGFRDILEMRRRDRPRTWGLTGSFEPVVPRRMRAEVTERVLADGSIHTPLALDEAMAAAQELAAAGAQAICVAFINAYANDAHERAAVEAIRAALPHLYVQRSTEILPEIREFERTSTTALNAYLQPVVSRYFDRLEGSLRDKGFSGQVLIVQSNGGVMTVETASRLPVRTALSGPAAGVIAASAIAEAAGFPDVITGDMGGTSFDVSLVAKGTAAVRAQTAIDFGLVIRTPMIDIHTIGAGGGSIAAVDSGGLLTIGPESAGSNPGPAAYGLGNERPTVTDANVLLGRINADRPIGGKLKRLDVEAARAAIERHVARPLGLDAMAAAEAIIDVANAQMAGAIRLVSIEKGYDPRGFALMPFGGGGALHAGALMKDVGLNATLVPRFPGITSALGCVIADMRQDAVQTVNAVLGQADLSTVAEKLSALAGEGRAAVAASGVTFAGIDKAAELDMAYVGQSHTIAVPLDAGASALDEAAIGAAFDRVYTEAYGGTLPGVARRIINLRVTVTGRRPRFDLSLLAPAAGLTVEGARRGTRRVWFSGRWHETAIYARLDLPVGAVIAGPAILEQPDTTILVEPDLEARVDRFGNTVITRRA